MRIFKRKVESSGGGPRILAYCAGVIGMGPYARIVRVLGEVKRRRPDVSILLMTDANDCSTACGEGIAQLILPGYCFSDATTEKEQPEHLALTNRELRNLRAQLILSTAKSFKPDLFFMDSNPHGKKDEAEPALRWLSRSGTKTCLMMRDIPAVADEPYKLRGERRKVEGEAALYSRILIAGDQQLFNVAEEFGWPASVRRKLVYAGFVVPAARSVSMPTLREHVAPVDPSKPFILATFGGGWEAESLSQTLMESLVTVRKSHRTMQLVIVTGPAVAEGSLKDIKKPAGAHEGVALIRFTPYLQELIAQSEAVVLQAGSTAYQVLKEKKPMVLLVRNYRNSEQDVRARQLEKLLGIGSATTQGLTPKVCATLIESALKQRTATGVSPLSFDGIQNAADEVLKLLP